MTRLSPDVRPQRHGPPWACGKPSASPPSKKIMAFVTAITARGAVPAYRAFKTAGARPSSSHQKESHHEAIPQHH